jgi:N,N-dimethylformamidase
MLKITGYADRISARPSETIEFKVNCEHPNYRADLVRLICGDVNPAGPGFKEIVVPSAISRRFPGRRQAIAIGSHAVVESAPPLEALGSFTVAAFVWPTTPAKGEQGLLARLAPAGTAGFALLIDAAGGLALRLGDGKGRVETVATGRALRARTWYLLAAAYDAGRRRVTLVQVPLEGCVGIADRRIVARPVKVRPACDHAGPLLFAALPGKRRQAGRSAVAVAHFNGRLDSPRLARAALAPAEIETLLRQPAAERFRSCLVGAWDFGLDIPTDRISDCGPYRLHGRTVNLPTRGVTGHNWTGEEHCWSRAPAQYGAIHFHDDDLYDAGWDTDFVLELRARLESGIYAARLVAGEDEERIPFVVLPERGREKRLALLLPTATYMAYANEAMGFTMEGAEQLTGKLAAFSPTQLFLVSHPEYGLSLYDSHSDGSGVCYSSRLRPVLNMRPKYQFMWSCFGKEGSNLREFNADLGIVDWLTHIGEAHDVITDEDLHREGYRLLSPYRALITGGHPEYTSRAMREALSDYTGKGGRLMYLGGNGFYWRTAFSEAFPGAVEIRRAEGGIRTWEALPGEYFISFTGEYGGLWRRQGGRAPQALVGVGFTAEGFDKSSYYRRTEASFDKRAAFIFEGIGPDERIGDFGFHGDGAAGNELDRADPLLGTPPNALIVARSEGHTALYFLVNEDVLVNHPWLDGTTNPLVHADMVFFETANEGAVFSVGSIAYTGSLACNGYRNNVARLTGNVLRRFLDPAPWGAR